MSDFRISYHETTYGHSWVTANTAEEALEKFQNGECEFHSDASEDLEITGFDKHGSVCEEPEEYDVDYVQLRLDLFGPLKDQYGKRIPMDLVCLQTLGEQYFAEDGSLELLMNADWYEDDHGNLWVSGRYYPESASEEVPHPDDVLMDHNGEIHSMMLVQPVLHRIDQTVRPGDIPDAYEYIFYHA